MPKLALFSLKFSLLISILILISACSIEEINLFSESEEQSSAHPNPQQTVNIIQSLRLYQAKNSFRLKEFEQFSLSNNSLFYECGQIKASKHLPSHQGVINLEDETYNDLILKGMEVLGRASKSKKISQAETGDLKGFADPGKVILNLTSKDKQSIEVKSGFNEVAEPNTALEESLKNLSSALRNIVKESKGDEGLCDNESFYGIP